MDPRRIEPVARRHGIELLVQFGSTVAGQTHAQSDLDLGVLLDVVPESFGPLSDLIVDLQTLADGREVDLTVLNHADPLLLKQVTDHGRLLYGSERRFQALKLQSFKRYQDYRRYLAMERAYVDRKSAGAAK